MTKLQHKEGTLFAVPLGTGKYGIGLVARMARKGGIIFAYFFGPIHARIPNINDLDGLMPEDAIMCQRVGDLGIVNKSWPIIGQILNWNRDNWPIPPLIRKERLSQTAWISKYSDLDPSKLEGEDQISYETDGYHQASLLGYGACEKRLKQLFGLR